MAGETEEQVLSVPSGADEPAAGEALPQPTGRGLQQHLRRPQLGPSDGLVQGLRAGIAPAELDVGKFRHLNER